MDRLDIVLSDEFGRTVEENIERDPVRIALDGNVRHAALVASQVKYLQRARHKLPSYYAARCILPGLAFEQSSSEATAARKNYSGGLALDLTCGLGVDSFFLSKRFERVIALEVDGELAAVARENFRRLGAHNIEVVNRSAEKFCEEFCGVCCSAGRGADSRTNSDAKNGANGRVDLVYADPDRRAADGKKLVRLEDCSPDVVALLPRLGQISPRIAVKLSPLFDVDEVFRIFGRHTRVEVVSVAGECKEILAETGGHILSPTVSAVATGTGGIEYADALARDSIQASPFERERYRYLVVPDVALGKARLVRRYFSERDIWVDSDNGYGFAVEKPENVIGRVYRITSMEHFDPKALKRRLRTEGVGSVEILKRNFPLPSADIARRLGVGEGGETKIAFTAAAGELWQIHLASL